MIPSWCLLVLFVLLTACGGGDGGAPPRPSELAEKIGCTNFEAETETKELGSREQGLCELGEETVFIHTYANNEQRDSIQEIAQKLGGGITVLGDRFAVRVDSQEAAEKVRQQIGGKIS